MTIEEEFDKLEIQIQILSKIQSSFIIYSRARKNIDLVIGAPPPGQCCRLEPSIPKHPLQIFFTYFRDGWHDSKISYAVSAKSVINMRWYPNRVKLQVTRMECLFGVVGTSFKEQRTGGARYHHRETELHTSSAAPRAQTGTRSVVYIAEGTIG